MQEKNKGRMLRKQMERQLAMKMDADVRSKEADDQRKKQLQVQVDLQQRKKEAGEIAKVGRSSGVGKARRRVGL